MYSHALCHTGTRYMIIAWDGYEDHPARGYLQFRMPVTKRQVHLTLQGSITVEEANAEPAGIIRGLRNYATSSKGSILLEFGTPCLRNTNHCAK